MPIDIKAKAPNIALTPIIFLRWLASVMQLVVIMGAEAFADIKLPAQPLLMLVCASFAVNIYSMVVYKRRQVPEETVRLHLIFDVLQYSGILFFTGGTANPFSVLLLAPLAMAASLLSLYSLCLLIMLTVISVSFMAFGAQPLMWHGAQPFLPPQYTHSEWTALMLTLIVISFIIWRLAMEGRRINDALTKTHTILEEKRRTTALGALAAAAVHELGSPLGTISIVTSELEKEILPDDPIAEDIALLKAEAEKCKRILAEIARNPTKTFGQGDPMRFDRMIMEIASEQSAGNRVIKVSVQSRVPENLPSLQKNANLDFGIGNLIGNAMSFASTRVDLWVEGWSEIVEVTVRDDGPGFTPQTLKSIGQPYISTREAKRDHMGLGIFIAMNLLEATGAALFFSNHEEGGAFVRVIWPRSALEAAVPSR